MAKKIAEGRAELNSMASKQGTRLQCPCCEEWLWIKGAEITKDDGAMVAPPAAQEKLAAALVTAEATRTELIGKLSGIDTEIRGLSASSGASEADKLTKKAYEYHQQVQAWSEVCDALGPSGVPLEIMKAAVDPVNARLKRSASITNWDEVVIRPDLEVESGGRIYGLLSESERWRVDITLAEAIAALSGVKLVIADGFDCLSVKNRGVCLGWVTGLAQLGEQDTIIILGTMKALPPKFPPSVAGLWLEAGKQKVVS